MSPQKSFANYRQCIRSAHAPLIPYLGVYMQDMVFLEDGNPDYLKVIFFFFVVVVLFWGFVFVDTHNRIFRRTSIFTSADC